MGKGRKRKRRGYWCYAKKKKCDMLQPGSKGVLLTCNHNERFTCLDGYRILNEYADQMYGPEYEAEGALRLSQSEFKAKAEEMNLQRRFQQLDCNVKHVVFIRTAVPNVTDLVERIFEDAYVTKLRRSNTILRIFPIAGSCNSNQYEFSQCLTNVLKEFREFNSNPKTYGVDVKVRFFHGTNKFNFKHFTRIVIQDVKPHWTPRNSTNYDYLIYFNVLETLCCISILENFDKYLGYNYNAIVDPEPYTKKGFAEAMGRTADDDDEEEEEYEDLQEGGSIQFEKIPEKDTGQQPENAKQETVTSLSTQPAENAPQLDIKPEETDSSSVQVVGNTEPVSMGSSSVQQADVKQEGGDSSSAPQADVKQEGGDSSSAPQADAKQVDDASSIQQADVKEENVG